MRPVSGGQVAFARLRDRYQEASMGRIVRWHSFETLHWPLNARMPRLELLHQAEFLDKQMALRLVS